MPQEIPVELLLEVRRVGQGAERMGLGVRLEFLARGIEQRPDEPAGADTARSRDAREAGRAAAAHQVQQHGFRLVVAVVRAQQPVAGL